MINPIPLFLSVRSHTLVLSPSYLPPYPPTTQFKDKTEAPDGIKNANAVAGRRPVKGPN